MYEKELEAYERGVEMKKENFRNASPTGFCFIYERELEAGEEILLKMPIVTANKRGVNDVGFAYENGICLYGTLSGNPEGENAIWQQIQPYDEVNKTTSYLKIVNTGEQSARVNVRAILN